MNFTFFNNKKWKLYFWFYGLYFICYLGLGAYFVSLSPYILQKFKESSYLIFLSGQISYPLGYFFAGWISDKTKKLKVYGILFSIFLFPTQYLLFDHHQTFWVVLICSGLVRFLFAALIQILQIATLEKIEYHGFSISRSAGTLGFLAIQSLMYILESFFLSKNVSLEIVLSRGAQYSSLFHIFTLMLIIRILPVNRKSQSHYYFKEVMDIIVKQKIYIFLLLSFFYHLAYQIVDFYLGRYFFLLGGMKFVYLSWIIAVLLEIPFFYKSQILLYQFGMKTIFLSSLLAGFLRFFLMFLNIQFFESNQWIILTQLLHGIHFTGYMAGSIYFFHKKFPEQYFGTAFGIFMIVSLSLGSITGNLIYGNILHILNSNLGYSVLFFISFSIFFILFLIILLNKKIDLLF